VENKADASAENNEPIIKASYSRNSELVNFLIENKADVTTYYNWPLKEASYRGHLDVVKILVKNKADITTDGNGPIRYASKKGNLNVVNFLLSEGADYNEIDYRMRVRILQDKYYRKWRKIYFKRFIRKVVLPLYYSSGFIGSELEKRKMEEEFN